MSRVVAIIPARGGSKGIPNKNVRSVLGKPLLAHTIEHALTAVDDVYVSTEDKAIAEVASYYGAIVIDRPLELASDTATSESVLAHALDIIKPQPDVVVFMQATSPLRLPHTLSKALEQFEAQQADSLFSACRARGFLWRVDQSPKPLNYNPAARPRRQDAVQDVIENGSFYIFKTSMFRDLGVRLGGKTSVYLQSFAESIEIDEPSDLELVELLTASTLPVQDFDGVSVYAKLQAQNLHRYYARRPHSAGNGFERSYWRHVVDPDGQRRDRTQERAQCLDDLTAEFEFLDELEPGKILDVGCGLGYLLSGLDGWDCYGVDVSAFAVAHASQWGAIRRGTLRHAQYPSASFDVVVMHHVIEHVNDPCGLIREVRRVLKPRGKLIFATPDFDNECARRFGERYRLLMDQTHVSLFSNESAHRFLRDHGFVIDEVQYPYYETRHFSPSNALRLAKGSGLSPPAYGNFMTFYCTKPLESDARDHLLRLQQLSGSCADSLAAEVQAASARLYCQLHNGNAVFACGNGGSAADAQHFAAELVGRFGRERRPLPAIALSSDPSTLTAIANDYGYERVFERQIEAHAIQGDVLVAISTSGQSENVSRAIRQAQKQKMHTIALIGDCAESRYLECDHVLQVPSDSTPHIQEIHTALLHSMCDSVERAMAREEPCA